MTDKFKHRRRMGNRSQALLSHDLRIAKYQDGLHNHRGQGALPSRLGWGQHRSRKDRVSLPDPWGDKP